MSSQAYVGSQKRTFQQALIHEMETNYGFLNSKRLLALLAADVQRLVDQFYPPSERVPTGWIVFTGTKATGPKAFPGQDAADQTSVTISWPFLTQEDLAQMATQPDTQRKRRDVLIQRLVRLLEHGWHHPQGPVLLTQADLSLMLGLTTVEISQLLKEARGQTGKPLLTKGYFFDQGLRPTHKAEVVALYENGLDEADIARTTQHSPTSVGHYLRDYLRVKELATCQFPPQQIAHLLGMRLSIVDAYLELLLLYHPQLVPNAIPAQIGA